MLKSESTGNEEAVRAYTMIDPIQQMLDDIEELMKYRNYQPAIDKITEVLEVGKFNLLNICFFPEWFISRNHKNAFLKSLCLTF